MKTLRGPNPSFAGPPTEMGPSAAEVGQLVVVAAALAQGAAVGIWLTLFPGSALRAGGFPATPDLLVRWAGLLYLVLAAGYALEWVRFRRVVLLVVGKAAAALFFLALALADTLPGLLYLAMATEAGVACAAAGLRGPADRARHARARLKLVVSRPSRGSGIGPSRSSRN
jgi:hypothetical protein